MPITDRPPGHDKKSSGTGTMAAGIGAAVLMVICCAGPALVAAGALAGIGGLLGNPWVIATAVVVLAAAAAAPAATVVRRRRSGRDACCSPTRTEDSTKGHRR
ncbi:mercury transporter [Streptomyces sp. NPDC004051]